jgi:glyoxylase-like metal-dependent hydrolase (beta-lactamase superfamily II)
MLVAAFPAGPWATNCYVVATADREECLVIDPGMDAASGVAEERNACMTAEDGQRLNSHGQQQSDCADVEQRSAWSNCVLLFALHITHASAPSA